MRDGWGKMHRDLSIWFNIASFQIDYIKLLKSQRVLRVIQITNQFKHLQLIDRVLNVLVIRMNFPRSFL